MIDLATLTFKPLPKRVKVDPAPRLPLFNDGSEMLYIVDEDNEDNRVCTHRYKVPDRDHPQAAEYLALQKGAADRLASIINAGLASLRYDAQMEESNLTPILSEDQMFNDGLETGR